MPDRSAAPAPGSASNVARPPESVSSTWDLSPPRASVLVLIVMMRALAASRTSSAAAAGEGPATVATTAITTATTPPASAGAPAATFDAPVFTVLTATVAPVPKACVDAVADNAPPACSALVPLAATAPEPAAINDPVARIAP